MHVIVLLASFVFCVLMALVVFGADRKWLLTVAGIWVAGMIIALCIVFEAPLHMQYDDYQHYDNVYMTHFNSFGVPEEYSNEWMENDFIFYPVLRILGYNYENMFFFMKYLYILMAPLAMMCAWLLFRDVFAARATGLFYLLCPVLIRFAGSVTLTLPGNCLYLVSVLFMLLFVERRKLIYIFISVPVLLIVLKTKSEHFLFVPSYFILAFAADRTFPRPGRYKDYQTFWIIVAVFLNFFVILPLLFQSTGAKYFGIPEYITRIKTGYKSDEFINQTLEYIRLHAVYLPPVVMVKILTLLAWRSKKHRWLFLALAAHFIMFFALYSVSFVVESLEQYRYAICFTFPIYALAGLGLSQLRGKKTIILIWLFLLSANLIYHYSLIPAFRHTPKYREFAFLKTTLPKLDDCKVMYVDYNFADESPGFPLTALGKPKNIIPIESQLVPRSALYKILILFNMRQSATAFEIVSNNKGWVREALQPFLYSIRNRDLSKENFGPKSLVLFQDIQRYVRTAGAELPHENDPSNVWKNRFTDALKRGDCYYFYFGRTDQLIKKSDAKPVEPYNFIIPYLEFGKEYKGGELSLKRITGINEIPVDPGRK